MSFLGTHLRIHKGLGVPAYFEVLANTENSAGLLIAASDLLIPVNGTRLVVIPNQYGSIKRTVTDNVYKYMVGVFATSSDQDNSPIIGKFGVANSPDMSMPGTQPTQEVVTDGFYESMSITVEQPTITVDLEVTGGVLTGPNTVSNIQVYANIANWHSQIQLTANLVWSFIPDTSTKYSLYHGPNTLNFQGASGHDISGAAYGIPGTVRLGALAVKE